MEITFQTTITPLSVTITLPHGQGKIFITEERQPLPKNAFYLFFEQKQCIAIGQNVRPKKWDKLVLIQFSCNIKAEQIKYCLQEKVYSSRRTIETDDFSKEILPDATSKKKMELVEEIIMILALLGYSLEEHAQQEKKKAAKSRHRWTKEVSEIPFTVHFRNSQATLYWIGRHEMLIKAGATLLPEAPLNKDGSVSYAAKYGEKLREDHKDQIVDNHTTKDIIVKSVNEASLLLYFGGTNSWLEMVDEHGKTLEEWTKL